MKTIGAALTTHIGQEVTTLATLWRLTRTDGQEFFFTDHDQDIVYSGDTYESAVGYNRTAIDNAVGFNVDNLDVEGFLESSSLQESELRAGLFDYATVRIMIVNWDDLTQGEIKQRKGWIGEVTYSELTGRFRTELRGLTQAYSQKMLEIYQPECRADLGDGRCKIAINPTFLGRSQAVVLSADSLAHMGRYAVDTTLDGTTSNPSSPIWQVTEDLVWKVVQAGTTAATQPTYAGASAGSQVTDGTAILEAEEAFKRYATVATVTDNQIFTLTVTEARANVDDWFKFGVVEWITGNNAGLLMEVKAWTEATNTVTLFLSMPFTVQVGDTLSIYAGCDKQKATCVSKFANIINFRGEPYVPGQDEFYKFPDARR